MRIEGTFEIKMTGEPPFDEADGVSLARARFDKVFSGPLKGTSVVTFLSARTPIADSAGYVALERIVGEVEGKAGSFVTVHTGLMNRGQQSLTIQIVPDSGTGALTGIKGTMNIRMVGKQHHYELDAEF